MGDGGGEALGAVVCLQALQALGIFRHSGREPGTSNSLASLPRRVASSSGEGEVSCSSPVGFRRNASTMSYPPRAIKEPYIFGFSCQSCRECLSWPLTLWHRSAVPRLGQGLLLPHDPEIFQAKGISKGHEILSMKPAKPGWGIQPP